ncbi:MAG: hypothetical protein CMM44_07620 [Rhodospirillaceae bacterium]|nr:hypothetical protein [Rhodospirillaceae bacterium]
MKNVIDQTSRSRWAERRTVELPTPSVQLGHIHLVTVVWGELHRNLLTEVSIPTILAPNNLPAIYKSVVITYSIITTFHDAAIIRSSPAFRTLSKICEVNFIVQDTFRDRDIFSQHHYYQHQEQLWAKEKNALLVTIVPDIAWGDGAFKYLKQKYDMGYRAFFIKCLRPNLETFIKDFRLNFKPDKQNAVTISNREMARLLIDHLHPLVVAQFADADHFASFSEVILWRTEPNHTTKRVEGLLIRAPFPSDFLIVDPSAGFRLSDSQMLNEGLEFNTINFVTNSDQIMMVSLTPSMSYNEWYLDRGPMNLLDVAKISKDFGDQLTEAVLSQQFRIHTGKVPVSGWSRAAHISSLKMYRMYQYRETLKIIADLDELGCSIAARLLAFALHEVHPLPHIKISDGATIFAPDNSCFKGTEKIDALASDKDLLKTFLRGLIISGMPNPQTGQTRGYFHYNIIGPDALKKRGLKI